MDPKTRTELIASYGYGEKTALAEAPPAPETPEEEQAEEDAIATAIESAIAAQEADEDVASDPNDQKTLKLLQQAKVAHEADVKAETPTTAAGMAPKPEAPGKGTMPTEAQADKKGPENGDICQNPDCGHTAAMHANEQGGDNVGACSQPNCMCPNFQKENEEQAQVQTPQEASMAAPAVAAEGEPKTDQNAPPPVEGSENMGAPFTIPVGIIEGQDTGDGRSIATGALAWREPPMPLMLLTTNPHDPSGMSPNDPAVIAGRIDSLERVPGEGSTEIIAAKGFCLPDENGARLAQLCESMGRLGVSADVAVNASQITSEMEGDGIPMFGEEETTIIDGTIMGFTACPFPAFEGAYMILGDGSGDQPEAIAQRTDDGSVEEAQTPPLAASIHFMTYEECVPCQQGFDVVTAAGGPARPPKAWFADPCFTEGDGRLVEIFGKNGPEGKYACPLTVTDDGRVFGHIAPWDTCHTGHLGTCVVAPRSKTDYAYFRLGTVLTAEGEQIKVGKLTADVGHATTKPGVRGFTAPEAIAHYDNAALQVAYVNIGEDDYGIWVAGAVAPTATEEQVQKLRASSISGDWRGIAGKPELVAALCVNQPGFPLAVVAGGQQSALVAAGAAVMANLKRPHPTESGLPAWAEGPLLALAASAARERISALG